MTETKCLIQNPERSSLSNSRDAAPIRTVHTKCRSGCTSAANPQRTWQLDVSLSRKFAMGETQDLEFRVEAFNLTNSLIRDNPNASFNSSRFGRITSGQDARVMQFALKYAF